MIAIRNRERSFATRSGPVCAVTPAQGALVYEVVRAGESGSTTSQLAESLGISSPAVSQLVDSLAHGGILGREQDPTDRRRFRIRLTARGEALYRDFDGARMAQVEALVAELSDQEVALLGELLSKMTKPSG